VRSRLREGSATVSQAEALRAKAAECEKKADQAKDLEAKRVLRKEADNWRTMALQADRFGW
jgi:hypothetical protein